MLADRHKASLKSIFAQTYSLTQYSHNVLSRLGHQLMNHSALRYRHSDDLITRWPCQAISPIPLFRPKIVQFRPSTVLLHAFHQFPLTTIRHWKNSLALFPLSRESLLSSTRSGSLEEREFSLFFARERESASACVITGRPLKATRLVSADRPPEYTP